MALERVQLLKQESAALGGDGADQTDYPSPLDPTEDVPEVRGLYIETETSSRDSKALISRTGDDMTFKDGVVTGGVTLGELLNGKFASAISDGTAATSSTSFQTKLTTTTATLPAGDYEIGWLMEGILTTHGVLTPGQFEMQARIDGTEEGLVRNRSEATNDHRVVLDGHKVVTLASPATITIDLRYRVINANDGVTVSRARIVLRSTKGARDAALDNKILTTDGGFVYTGNADLVITSA